MPTDLRAGRTYQVSAHYNGHGCYQRSDDTVSVTVGSDTGGAARPGPVIAGAAVRGNPASGLLPSTGSDAGIAFYGIGGVALVGAGGVLLGLRRRRSHT